MLTCSKTYSDIPFAHRQFRHKGHCSHIHGHNWSFKITFGSETRDVNGFIVDFGELAPLKEFFSRFDHGLVLLWDDPMVPALEKLLDEHGCNNVILLKDGSCEGLAAYVLTETDRLVRGMTLGRAWVYQVDVWEDSKNQASATFGD